MELAWAIVGYVIVAVMNLTWSSLTTLSELLFTTKGPLLSVRRDEIVLPQNLKSCSIVYFLYNS